VETTDDEAALLASLRDGDERAFATLVERHTSAMIGVARQYVSNREAAEDVVQETWIALIKGVSGFEGRASLRTWLFAVLINIAKARGTKERRYAETPLGDGGTVDPNRFRPADDPSWPGHWRDGAEPRPFPETPEGSLLGEELKFVARMAIDHLPERQRIVVTMRDMLDFDSGEVCTVLNLSLGNQRVLLHRGRSAVRQALEDYLQDSE